MGTIIQIFGYRRYMRYYISQKCKFVLLASILLCFIQETILPQSYPFEIYTSEDGMAGTDVREIFQDSGGYIWVGTDQGLSRFDGLIFTSFRPGIDFPGKDIHAITEDTDGRIWVGTDRGLGRFDGRNWEQFTTEDGIIDNDIRAVLFDRNKIIWLGTMGGVSRYDGSEWTNFTEEEGIKDNYILSILEDKEGRLWFGTDAGVCRFDGDQWQEFTTRDGLAHDSVISMAEDSSGNLWFGSYEKGVSRYNGKAWRIFSLGASREANNVHSITEDSRGNLWFPNGEGAAKFDGGNWTSIGTKNGLPVDRVAAVLEDREGNLWFGTREGLCRLPATSIVNFTESDGLNIDNVTAVCQDSKGHYWFGMYEGGLQRFDGKKWKSYFYEWPGLPSNPIVNSIIEDRSGNIWAAFAGQGIGRFDGSKWEIIDSGDGLAGDIVISLIEDSRGNIWAGTWENGACSFDGRGWETFTIDDGLPSNNVNALLEDRNGIIWFGTYGGGLAGLDENGWKVLDTSNGLADNFINTLFEDEQGNIWIGTERHGVSRYNGSDIKVYTTDDGLPSNTCFAILQGKGGIYFGTNNGIACFNGETFKVLTTEDGLISNDINRGSCLKDNRGDLWFGTKNGVSRYSPYQDRNRKTAPPVYLDRTHLLGSAHILSPGAEMEHYENYIGFEYSGISFSSPRSLRYSFMLEGLDETWRISKSRSIEYPNLPAGSYTFKVKAFNRDGMWSPEPAAFSFIINPPFWATWWFMLISTIIVLGATYGIFREWHRRKSEKELKEINARLKENNLNLEQEIIERKKSEEQRRKSEEKRAVLEANLLQAQKMESIGRLSGGIAHDFNNMLSPIIGYSEMIRDSLDPRDTNYEMADEILKAGQRAGDLTRQLLAFSRKQLLEMRILDLNQVLKETEEMLRRLLKEDIELTYMLEPSLGNIKADRTQIQQILLNLVINANDAIARYGKITIETANVELDEKYAATHIDAQPGPHVMLAVSDNGVGMDQATVDQIFEPFFTTKKKGKGTGLGLATVHGIAKQHGGNIYVYSEPGEGTTFKVYLPRVWDTEKGEDIEVRGKDLVHKGEKVLVVEDEDLVRKLAVAILEKHGYQVISAENPKKAMALAEKIAASIDLLVTDVVMPGATGRDLFRDLQALNPDLKVLYMSGYTENVIAHHGIIDEGILFLQKPFTEITLLEKVRQAMEDH